MNPKYVPEFEAAGMKFVGHDSENVRMEIMELSGSLLSLGSDFLIFRAGEPANFLAASAPDFFFQAAPTPAPDFFSQAAPASVFFSSGSGSK